MEKHQHTQFLDLTNGEGGERILLGAAAASTTADEFNAARIAINQASNGTNASISANLSEYEYVDQYLKQKFGEDGGNSGSDRKSKRSRNRPRRGGRNPNKRRPQRFEESSEDDDDDNDDDDSDEEQQQVVKERMKAQSKTTSATSIRRSSQIPHDPSLNREPRLSTVPVHVDPSTPGKVVETGHEHTGRWTKEEHEAFLTALQLYGKEWKKVAAKVKTRTVVQTRTHAQKYFQKLAKTVGDCNAIHNDPSTLPTVDMGITAEAKKASAAKKKQKKAALAALNQNNSATPERTALLSEATPLGKVHRQSSTATFAAAQMISNLSNHHHNSNSSALFSQTGGEGVDPILSAAAHGFGASKLNLTQQHAAQESSTFGARGGSSTNSGGWLGRMQQIVAPDPNDCRSAGKFSEPSPAATGKRKLAEIAAARMLAGVAGVGVNVGVSRNTATANNTNAAMVAASSSSIAGATPGHAGALTSGSGVSYLHQQEAAVPQLPCNDDDSDGPPTPPPSDSRRELLRNNWNFQSQSQQVEQSGAISLKDAPPPPLFGNGTSSSKAKKGMGLTLQIVNPETLGITFEEQQRRKRLGDGDSPVTPWDGQLEALVIEKQKTEEAAASMPSSVERKAMGDRNFRLSTRGHASVGGTGAHGNDAILPVSGPANAYNRTELHQAVCEMNLKKLVQQLSIVANQSDAVLQKWDDAGYCPLHTACAANLNESNHNNQATHNNDDECEDATGDNNNDNTVEVVRGLLAAGADAAREDSKGNTPLHWAARAGDTAVAELLLLRNSPLDAKNNCGETPLHWSMRAGRNGMGVTSLLLENGGRPGILSVEFKRPIDVAADGFVDEEGSVAALRVLEQQRCRNKQNKQPSREYKKALKETADERRDARANLLIRSAHSRTLVLHHPECLEHHPKSTSDWEVPDRITRIMNRVAPSSDSAGVTETSGIFPHEVTVSKEFDRAKLELLSRVHSTEYLSFVNELSKDLEKQLKEAEETTMVDDSSNQGADGSVSSCPPAVVPFTPMVQRTMIKLEEPSVKLGVNSDTSFSSGSLKAARRAAGAVQHAVDCVLVGRNRNAFCVVRPPGHHAGINGLLAGGESCGFCLFNNVAAGALYAISDDRLLCDKCAIVDIDVHHGNGTEEIVRKCQDPSKLFFFSIHLFDVENKRRRNPNSFVYKFYPGTGSEDDLALNIINVPITPLWRNATPAPAPVPRPTTPTKRHNTRQKKARSSNSEASEEAPSDSGTPRGSGSRAGSDAASSEAGSANNTSSTSTSSQAHRDSATSGRLAYRQAIQNRLLPALRAFNPDLILLSSGFDACKGDVGNAKHERDGERMGIDLEPEDYAWTTRKILEIADICCQGRVVSVLEGGYGKTSVSAASPGGDEEESSAPLDRSLFAECAVRHLQAMIDPYNTENRFSS